MPTLAEREALETKPSRGRGLRVRRGALARFAVFRVRGESLVFTLRRVRRVLNNPRTRSAALE